VNEPLWFWALRMSVRNFWRRRVTFRGQRTLQCDTCTEEHPRAAMRPARLRDGSLTWECPGCADCRSMLQAAFRAGARP
jgi:flavoprotein